MSTCNGCGGVVGRDCYNPQECEWISRDQQARAMARAMAREYAQPDDDRISALEAEVSELRAIIAATLPAAPAPTEQVTFDRRWSLARDGFGLVRDDAEGNYVAHDDAVAVIHDALAARQAPDIRDAALDEAATLCDAQALEPECPERATYCADAIRALKGPAQ